MKIFVTVGNALVPFDRLLGWVDLALSALPLPSSGVCQRGPSKIDVRGLLLCEHLSRLDFEHEMQAADVVICHAGVGTLKEAFRRGHRPIVVPRRASFGEIVNDHQLEITRVLAAEDRLEIAEDASSLREALLRYARGERSRGAPLVDDPSRLAPLARALEQGPTRAKGPFFGGLFVRALALLGPTLESMRVR